MTTISIPVSDSLNDFINQQVSLGNASSKATTRSRGLSGKRTVTEIATSTALRESEIRYRTVFEHSKDMIYIANPAGDFISINDSATELLGYSREELFTMKVYDLYEKPAYWETFEKKND